MKHNTIDIWQDYKYAGSNSDGFRPTMDTYILKGGKPRPAIMICPGGGYAYTSPREAEPIALQFNAAGYHAFVLNYSVSPRCHPQPILDLSRAMCIVRKNAQDWMIDADKIAVCGFSAGGHLAASLGVFFSESYIREYEGITPGLNKPNSLILCYPVISSGSFAHKGSFENLLGNKPEWGLIEKLSLENQVNEKTPPAFLWHTFEDDSVPVENSIHFALGLRRHNIPFELHVYPKGGHGLSLATKETDTGGDGTDAHVATWMKLCTEWLGTVF